MVSSMLLGSNMQIAALAGQPAAGISSLQLMQPNGSIWVVQQGLEVQTWMSHRNSDDMLCLRLWPLYSLALLDMSRAWLLKIIPCSSIGALRDCPDIRIWSPRQCVNLHKLLGTCMLPGNHTEAHILPQSFHHVIVHQ
jgi:hypothetical protein